MEYVVIQGCFNVSSLNVAKSVTEKLASIAKFSLDLTESDL